MAPEGVLGDTRVVMPTKDLCGATEENSNPRCRTRAVVGGHRAGRSHRSGVAMRITAQLLSHR